MAKTALVTTSKWQVYHIRYYANFKALPAHQYAKMGLNCEKGYPGFPNYIQGDAIAN